MFSACLSGFLLLFGQFPTVTPQSQTATSAAAGERQRGINLYREGKFKEAVNALKATVKKDKTDDQAWYVLGLAQVELEDFKNATKSLQNVTQLQPAFALGHNALAYTFLRRNLLPDAIREADATLRLDPNFKDAHYIIGIANLRLDNTEEALKRAETVIKLDPKFAAAYLLKSQAQLVFSVVF